MKAPKHLKGFDWYLPHQAWLAENGYNHHDPEGANLQYANLQYANLQGANLQYANLQYANLQGANLLGANLLGANLQGANLQGANLQYANLQYAKLQYANLQGANLQYANLQYANLQGANLQGANLQGANLLDANHIICLPIRDPRGYGCVAINHGGKFIIRAGCHGFTPVEARKHWGRSYKGNREIGDMYLYALDWLKVNQRRLFKKWEAK